MLKSRKSIKFVYVKDVFIPQAISRIFDENIKPVPPENASRTYGVTDVFVSKFAANGAFEWSQRIGGIASDQGRAIATEASGNIVITGYISGNGLQWRRQHRGDIPGEYDRFINFQ